MKTRRENKILNVAFLGHTGVWAILSKLNMGYFNDIVAGLKEHNIHWYHHAIMLFSAQKNSGQEKIYRVFKMG